MRQRALGFAALATATLVVAGCSTVSNEPAPSGSDAAAAGPFTIGISNGFVGSEYRTQMIADIEEAASEYQEAGTLEELVLENADTDVNGQIQQVRNLINAGVDAIIADHLEAVLTADGAATGPEMLATLGRLLRQMLGRPPKALDASESTESTEAVVEPVEEAAPVEQPATP